ncbi:hypothetical protein CDAR_43521 [Caerostris darwini]|uniref:Uncharacterized protein n=1 Tax=Caerostris darwini TaxID=1538125 RepID=A0AAV4WK45_9ARAC|nr:hypothetical protein CDAR_43521 [Caerostris darwini]
MRCTVNASQSVYFKEPAVEQQKLEERENAFLESLSRCTSDALKKELGSSVKTLQMLPLRDLAIKMGRMQCNNCSSWEPWISKSAACLPRLNPWYLKT